MPPLAPTTVTALVFYVADLDRTERFYRDVLGLPLQQVPADEDHPGFLTADVSALSLVFLPHVAGVKAGSPVVVFGLDEGGIDDAVDALVRHNVEIVAPVAEAPDGGLTADFLDPDGHTLSFHQRADLPRHLAA